MNREYAPTVIKLTRSLPAERARYIQEYLDSYRKALREMMSNQIMALHYTSVTFCTEPLRWGA